MRKHVAYNILRSVWHHVVMSENAHIVLFEKTDTTRQNSNYFRYDSEQNEKIKGRFRRL